MNRLAELRQRSVPEIHGAMQAAVTAGLAMSKSEAAVFANQHISTQALWGICTLSAHDFFYSIPYEDRQSDLLMGPRDTVSDDYMYYEHGIMGKRVHTLYERAARGDELAQRRFENLSSSMADLVFVLTSQMPNWDPGLREASDNPHTMLANLSGEPQVHFADSRHPVAYTLEGPLDNVATLGPGLSGNTFQLAATGVVKDLYQIAGGLGGTFCTIWNQLNDQYIQAGVARKIRQGKHVSREFEQIPKSHYSTDGIAAGLGRLVAAGTTLDAVVMSSVHSAGPVECTAGIEKSAQLLRPGGYLCMLSINESAGSLAGLDTLMPVARRSFGEPLINLPCGSNYFLSDEGLNESMASSALVFQKA